MASVAFLRASLIASIASMTRAFTITPTTDAVTVRRGEQLQMSCDIGLEAGDTLSDIQEVRWFRGSNNMVLYGSLDVSRCNAGVFMCSNETTIDGRGTLYYSVTRRNGGASTTGTLTLTISSSLLEDNTTFYCAFLPETHEIAEIHVTVNYLPSTAYPICAVSSIQSEALTYVLVCSSDKGQPVVSLEWTTLVDSSRMSLSNTTVVLGNQVENTLHLSPVGTVYNKPVFTCYMTSAAYPGISRDCSIGPFTIFPWITPESTDTSRATDVRTTQRQWTVRHSSTTSTTSTHPTFKLDETILSVLTAEGQSLQYPTNTPKDKGHQNLNSPFAETTISTPTAVVTKSFPDASSSTVSIVTSAVSAVIIITLLAIIAYLVASRRKLQKILEENQSSLPEDFQDPRDLAVHINRSSGTSDDGQQLRRGMSLRITVQDRLPVNSANSSPGTNHAYETSILANSTPVPSDDMDHSTAQANINDGYTPYIVSEDGENSATQNTADTGYMPLALYEDI